MSKVKLLINEVFRQGEIDSGKDKKNGIALFLSVHLKESLKLSIDERTLVRYHDAFVTGIKDEISIEPYKLNVLSQYIGYENFAEFANTFVKKGEEANFTEVKVSIDGNESVGSKKSQEVNISITNINKPVAPVKEFLTKNGVGILEMTFVLLLVTGGVIFSNHSADKNRGENRLGIMSFMSPSKNFMYWDGEKYIETDSNTIGPEFEVIARDAYKLQYFKKIKRKDTMTIENSLGRTWYSKYNGKVEFFTADGTDPDSKKELRKSTPFMIEKYAGKAADSIQAE